MAEATRPKRPRQKLNRDLVLRTALQLADGRIECGLDAPARPGVARRGDVALQHVAGKDDILDGIADLVMVEVDVPARDLPWRDALRQSAEYFHVPSLASTPVGRPRPGVAPEPGPEQADRLSRCGRQRPALDGFALPNITRAFMAVDSHVYGFALTVLAWPFDLRDSPEEAAIMADEAFGDAFPACGPWPNLPSWDRACRSRSSSGWT